MKLLAFYESCIAIHKVVKLWDVSRCKMHYYRRRHQQKKQGFEDIFKGLRCEMINDDNEQFFYLRIQGIQSDNYRSIYILALIQRHVLINSNMPKILQGYSSILLILAVIIAIASSQAIFSLQHQTHQRVNTRHLLNSNHHKFVIYHNMRVFANHQVSHLRHDQTSAEHYGLNDMGYFFTLNLTIAGIPYRLNIDTGSSDIFIKGQDSPGAPANKYQCSECMDNNPKITIAYLDGALETYQADLEVELGPHTFNESILVAYTAAKNFQAIEGLVGLSFPQLARSSEPTFIQTLINNNIINHYSFGVNLNFQEHQRSEISFGAPNSERFQEELTYYPIKSGYSYSIKTKGVSIGEGPLLAVSTALLDTGNTCISIPDQYEKKILKQFNTESNVCGFDVEQNANQFSLLRCIVKNYDELPSLKIHIGKQIYEVDKDVYMQRCIKGDEDQGDRCDLYIESVKYMNQLFLGDGFFNRYYAYFNLQDRKIGIAKNKEVLSHTNMYIDESQMDDEDKAFFEKIKK